MDVLEQEGSDVFTRQMHEYTQSLTIEEQEKLADALQMQWQQEQQQQQYQQQQNQHQQIRYSDLLEQDPLPNDPQFSRSHRLQKSSPSSSSSSSPAYAAWARAQASGSTYFLMGGGVLCLPFPGWIPGVYSLLLGILVYLIERICSGNHNNNNNSNHSTGSSALAPKFSFTPSVILRPYWVRALIYITTAVPCFFRAPNYSGGICLLISGITYAFAATSDWKKRRQTQRSKRRNTASHKAKARSSKFAH